MFIITDLLEKARVISQQALERSYHIFYQMMSGSVKGVKGIFENNQKNIFSHVEKIFFIRIFINITII